MNGKAKIVFDEGNSFDGYFKDGVLHGFGRYFDEKGRLTFAGHHKSGSASGVCWRVIRGGGCIVGKVDCHGHLTGDNIAYIYPDYQTALLGTFENGVLIEARQSEVVGVTEDVTGVLVPELSKPWGEVHVRQSSIDTKFGLHPTLRDPYESRLVEIQGSEIEGAAEGLFALQDIEVNTVVAFYNGCKANLEDYDPETWETNNYKIFDPKDMPDGTIDIPVWAQVRKRYFKPFTNLNFQSSSAYCATLAHKTNHSFLPNSQFLIFDHPKYGLIPCISTSADVSKGEEVRMILSFSLS